MSGHHGGEDRSGRAHGGRETAFRPGTIRRQEILRIGLGLDTSSSVDDLRTQIKLSNIQGSQPCLATLQVARHVCLEHGYKTKAKILAAAIKKQEVAK
jgi:hypothetical protein